MASPRYSEFEIEGIGPDEIRLTFTTDDGATFTFVTDPEGLEQIADALDDAIEGMDDAAETH